MPGISFLFWNVKRQPLAKRVARLAVAHALDVVILAECEMPSATVSRAVNDAAGGGFGVVPGSAEGVRLFSRFPTSSWQLLIREQLDAWLGYALLAPGLPPLVLFVAHLPSKLQADPHDQLQTASLLSQDVGRMEAQAGHGRSLVVGDLNANPFEPSVAGAGGLHGVMTRDVAGRETRQIRGRDYAMFYNPMWGGFGDRTAGPPGTYYRSASGSVNYFWNTYDQVLLRPDLAGHLADLRVLDSDGAGSLLTANGLPDAVNASDHLPLFFRLEW